MSQYQFTNPGAMAGLAIARLLADRDEEVHKRREEEQRAKESEARIAAQKDSQTARTDWTPVWPSRTRWKMPRVCGRQWRVAIS
jgi:hypothetical protein